MKTFILSDESVNCYGYRVLTDGIRLDKFGKNPLMLYSHNRELLPIGTWENVRKEDGRLLAEAKFDENDEFAMQISDKVEKGIIRCCSIGFEIISLSDDPELLLPGQRYMTVTESQLLECSICALGANSNAMALSHDGESLKQGDILHLSMELELPNNNENMDNNENRIATLEAQVQELGNSNATLSQERDTLQARVTELTAQVETLQTQINDRRNGDINAMIDNAVREGRLSEGDREAWRALLNADYDNASKALANITKPTSLAGMINSHANASEAELAAEWDKADRDGRLAGLKASDPARFAELYKAKFGTEYNAK